jgi:hypothetical protein
MAVMCSVSNIVRVVIVRDLPVGVNFKTVTAKCTEEVLTIAGIRDHSVMPEASRSPSSRTSPS